ncbi:hypothetical protein LCGC14_1672090 [marine sediment metagenome]|uniref:Alginate lyase domain-containing protein n=1 Tax=marine sediment metagenome TaxID=412755 RepID=A0A0F9K6T7_9ZZZZ
MEHPCIFLDRAELAGLVDKAKAPSSDWGKAYRQLLAAGKAARAQPALSVTFAGPAPASGDEHDYATEPPYGKKDGVANKSADRSDYMAAIKLGKSVRNLGLTYALTGKGEYADKAIELINAWCINPKTRMNPKFTNQQSKIELCITMPGMFYGSDLIWGYPRWDREHRAAYRQWVGTLVKAAMHWRRDNNFENWRLVLVSSGAIIAGNEKARKYAFARWKVLLDHQMNDDGSMKYELGRTNSLSYSLYAINAMVQTAEIARHFGVDLYRWRSPKGRHLALALDFHARYALDPKQWTREQMHPYKGLSAAFMLSDGSIMDLSMCPECAEAPDLYLLWEVVMGGWLAEPKTATDRPTVRDDYVMKQFERGTFILDLFYSEKWTEIAP